jgi:hypothetical protein
MLNNFLKVIALVVLCCAGLLYGGAEAVPRLDCENNADDGLLCYDKLEGKCKEEKKVEEKREEEFIFHLSWSAHHSFARGGR